MMDMVMGGPPPRPYDRRGDHRSQLRPGERTKLHVHADACLERNGYTFEVIAQMQSDRYYDRRLLLAILMLLLGNGTLNLASFVGLFGH